MDSEIKTVVVSDFLEAYKCQQKKSHDIRDTLVKKLFDVASSMELNPESVKARDLEVRLALIGKLDDLLKGQETAIERGAKLDISKTTGEGLIDMQQQSIQLLQSIQLNKFTNKEFDRAQLDNLKCTEIDDKEIESIHLDSTDVAQKAKPLMDDYEEPEEE
jgi:hypothetical protein